MVRIDIYDVGGRLVATPLNELREPGEWRVRWDAEGMASGVYIARLTTNGAVLSEKMLLLK